VVIFVLLNSFILGASETSNRVFLGVLLSLWSLYSTSSVEQHLLCHIYVVFSSPRHLFLSSFELNSQLFFIVFSGASLDISFCILIIFILRGFRFI